MSDRHPLDCEAVRPIGKRTVQTIHGPMEVDRYPEEIVALGAKVRAIRVDLSITLREAAVELRLLASTLSSIEQGHLRLRSPDSALLHIRECMTVLRMRKAAGHV